VDVGGTLLFEIGLDPAHLGDGLFEGIALGAGLLLELLQLLFHGAGVKCQQFGMDLTLFLLQLLVALGGTCLTLGVLQLTLDFFT